MSKVKIKFFSMYYKQFKEVEEEVNSFCAAVNVIDIKYYDTRLMVMYTEAE